MQVKKKDVKKSILNVARNEFINSSFKDTSMRKIAAKANVGLSNIYNYFKNKDEIFCEVLAPLLLEFDKLVEEHNDERNITRDIFVAEDYQKEMIGEFMLIVGKYREELRLLLFKSGGSSLENFRETFADRQTAKGIEYFQMMKEKYPETNTNISQFFIRVVASWWLNIFGEIVNREELTEADTEQFFKEFIAFGTSGWQELMNL